MTPEFTKFLIVGGFIGLLLILLVLTIIQPLTRPKRKGPAHPMTKAGNLFALVALVFGALALLLDAGLGLVTAGIFMMIAVVCWVFGTAFAKRV